MFSAPGGATIFFSCTPDTYFQVAIAIMSMPATRPAAAPATAALIKQVIDEFGVLGLVLFRKIKRCFHIMRPPLKECRDTRLPIGLLLNIRYARMPLEVAQVIELRAKVDKIAHRRVFSCVHYGKPASPSRDSAPDPTSGPPLNPTARPSSEPCSQSGTLSCWLRGDAFG
jgi:hypothetical protein